MDQELPLVETPQKRAPSTFPPCNFINEDLLGTTHQLTLSYIPSKQKKGEDNFDQKQQYSVEDEQNAELIAQNALLLKRPSVQSK